LSPVQWYPAPGKLNLLLHVLGRRADGYHELQTVFRLIDRSDRIGIAVRDDGVLRRLDALPGVAPEDDLCLRAAAQLKALALAGAESSAAERLGADIALDKQLPMGAGLGGGSSDAATVLLVLNRLWDLKLGRPALMALAARLGADVPFFVFGLPALARGIGERLTAVSLPPRWACVVAPPVAAATAAIFAAAELTRTTPSEKMEIFSEGYGRNDLQAVAVARFPDIAAALARLASCAPSARMTGSGGCVFAWFASEAEASAALAVAMLVLWLALNHRRAAAR